jgi:hypothetical protein
MPAALSAASLTSDCTQINTNNCATARDCVIRPRPASDCTHHYDIILPTSTLAAGTQNTLLHLFQYHQYLIQHLRLLELFARLLETSGSLSRGQLIVLDGLFGDLRRFVTCLFPCFPSCAEGGTALLFFHFTQVDCDAVASLSEPTIFSFFAGHSWQLQCLATSALGGEDLLVSLFCYLVRSCRFLNCLQLLCVKRANCSQVQSNSLSVHRIQKRKNTQLQDNLNQFMPAPLVPPAWLL